MRLLLIGASGQLGRALAATFSPDHRVIPTACRHASPGDRVLDLGSREQILSALTETRPDAVVIAGAMCAVDRSELEPDLCRRINVSGPRIISEYVREHGGTVVYYSTDHVFDGAREVYRESDEIGPVNIYSQSKAEGEAAIRELLPDRHLLLRTSWVYGVDPQRMNFALRCVDSLRHGRAVQVPADQWGSPTYTDDLARATRFLLERGLSGTFHATGPDFVDRATLARRICRRFGLDDTGIVPKPTVELGQAAKRPLQVRLDCSKLRDSGAPPFRGVDQGLDDLAMREGALTSR